MVFGGRKRGNWPQSADAYMQEARALAENNRHTLAATTALYAVNLYGTPRERADAYSFAAQEWALMHNTPEALKALRSAIVILLGLRRESSTHVREAITTLLDAKQNDLTRGVVLCLSGLCFELDRRPQEAVGAYVGANEALLQAGQPAERWRAFMLLRLGELDHKTRTALEIAHRPKRQYNYRKADEPPGLP